MLRTHTITKKNPKHSQEWSWEETPELVAAIEQLHKSSEAVKAVGKVRSIFVPNSNPAPIKKKKNA
jgi:hypothetical protein|tara:strand:+ start:295 stop:492 length:198 start_codon:yes stop_codon:yes gene_type:complete